MKVKVVLSSDTGADWTAECKEIGLIASGPTITDALIAMKGEIRQFFAVSIGSNRIIEVLCSKIKANAAVTITALDPRPEKTLASYGTEDEDCEPLLLEGEEQLALSSGASNSDEIIDATFTVDTGSESS